MASQLFICSSASTGLEEFVLLASNDKLGPYVVSNQSRALFAQQPGRDITFARDSIQPEHIESRRQSYINAILIQSRGSALGRACDRCSKKSATGRKKNTVKRFAECRVAKGHFYGCCANCKWSDSGMKCSHVWAENDNEFQDEPEDGEDYEDIKDDAAKSEGKESEVGGENRSEGKDVRYENATDESNGENETVGREEDDEIVRKLLLPDFRRPSKEQMKGPITPKIEEESYSSEEEWQGFSP